MKKVLYVIGYPLRMTGSQKQIEQLIVHLPPEIKPTVLLSLEADVAQNFRKKGIEVSVIDPGSSLNSYGKVLLKIGLIEKIKVFIKEYWAYSKALKQYIKDGNFDLVHCNDGRAVVLVALGVWLSRVKMISHMQGDRAFKYNLYWFLFELLPKKIILNARFIKQSLSFVAQKKALTIYTGIEAPKPNQIEGWLKRQQKSRIIVGAFASVVPFKGAHHLIEAIALLKDTLKQYDTLFIWVGNFPEEYKWYQDWLFKRIQQLDIAEYIVFTGWTNTPANYMAICDITTLPSVSKEILEIEQKAYTVGGNEGFPTVHLEAMHLSKPIVGTQIAGVPEQIEDQKTGFIVPPSNPKALAKALETLLQNKMLREEMGKRGAEKVRQFFSLSNYVTEVVAVYKQIGNKHF